MSSWLSDLAGKAENILNKIDQNAANVLKNDSSEQSLLEVKCNGANDNVQQKQMLLLPSASSTLSSIKRNISSNSLKLQRTPKKLQPIVIEQKQIEMSASTPSSKFDSKALTANAIPDENYLTASSRRSSCSSRTEGVQTVIEYPMEKSMNDSKLSASSHSLQIADDEKAELMATKIMLDQVKDERDQMQAELTDLQKQVANAETNEIIASLEETCDRLTTDHEQLLRRLDEMETNCNQYIKMISDLETTVVKLHQTEQDLNEKMAWTKSESEQAAFELQQYRSRAHNTLQMKDELIAQLKCTLQKTSGDGDDAEMDVQLRQIETMELTKERDALADEVKMLRNQLDASKHFIHSLEQKYHDMETRFVNNEDTLNNAVRQEKLRFAQLEDALGTQAKELKAVRDEMKRQQLNYSTKLHEKDNELAKLRSKSIQQTAMGLGTVSATDDRIYSLTQSLVQKQNSLEAVTAERNAIRIQLEKMEHRHRDAVQMMRQQRMPQVINVNDTDDAKSQVPNFMQENPFDTRVARRVKRAYSSLDAVGIRLGVFMRRYPLIRILVIVYVAVLHLWVMLVLFTSTPN